MQIGHIPLVGLMSGNLNAVPVVERAFARMSGKFSTLSIGEGLQL
jgi:hypothetical protein